MFLRGLPDLCMVILRGKRPKSPFGESEQSPDFYNIDEFVPLPVPVLADSTSPTSSSESPVALVPDRAARTSAATSVSPTFTPTKARSPVGCPEEEKPSRSSYHLSPSDPTLEEFWRTSQML
jgi:hypothetical protein